MRVLLDEQLPRQLARHLVGHDARTVQQQSWAGLKNGALLDEAEAAGFAVLVTGDQNLEYQQNLTKRRLGVIVLGAASNALEDLLPLVANALLAIDRVQPGRSFGLRARPRKKGGQARDLSTPENQGGIRSPANGWAPRYTLPKCGASGHGH